MKRIGINLIAMKDERGTGTWRYLQLMMKQLAHYDMSNYTFIVYKQAAVSESFLDFPSSLNIEYVNIPNISNSIKRIIFEQTLFYRYIKKCDVFYSYCTSMPLFVKAKRVFTLHDVYFITNKERYSRIKRAYLNLITRLYIKQAHFVLTVSQYSESEILKNYKASVNKIDITWNFLEDNNPRINKLTEFNVNDVQLKNRKYFLYVGSIQPSKNIERLIRAFKIFQSKDGEYKLVIVGKPTYNGQLIIETFRNIDGVEYMGYVDRHQLELLYSNCFATCLVSLCEGFGIPILESYAYRRPTIVSNVTSLPEVAGNAGIKVNPLDIESISNGFDEVILKEEELVSHIPEQLKKFNRDKSCRTFLKALSI